MGTGRCDSSAPNEVRWILEEAISLSWLKKTIEGE